MKTVPLIADKNAHRRIKVEPRGPSHVTNGITLDTLQGACLSHCVCGRAHVNPRLKIENADTTRACCAHTL